MALFGGKRMKKKGLLLFLILPFLLGLLGVYAIAASFASFAHDITGIDWTLDTFESFKIRNDPYELKANPVYDKRYELAYGNELVWEVKNTDEESSPHAEVRQENDKYYLVALTEGEVTLTCRNQKGNIARSVPALIYERVAFAITADFPYSGKNIDPNLYIGRYDYNEDGNKVDASFSLKFIVAPSDMLSSLSLEEKSDNVSFSSSNYQVTVKGNGNAYLKFKVGGGEVNKEYTFSFLVPEESVNVYSYSDLLNATNRSKNGEAMVLRKNFESIKNAYLTMDDGSLALVDDKPTLKEEATACFGNYDAKNDRYEFASEVYRFKTQSNTEYIEQWNAKAKEDPKNYKTLSDELIAGLHVQKDVYGNGFTINFHNLAYPYNSTHLSNGTSVPSLRSDNLFRKPIYIYALGNPGDLPIVALYGQDNVGMYVDGDNITVNDVRLKNCDDPESLSFLKTVGTVIDVNGNGVSILNSVLENGKNVLRSFSSLNLTVKNCLLARSMNFLADLGTNEFVKVNGSSFREFKTLDGTSSVSSVDQYVGKGKPGDDLLNEYMLSGASSGNKRLMKEALLSLTRNEYDHTKADGEIKGSTSFVDTYFYQSGIACIGNETNFTGPYFYNNSPSSFTDLIQKLSGTGGTGMKELFPIIPSNIGGASYPYSVSLEGKTSFYDYKKIEEMDLTGILEQNVDAIATSFGVSFGGLSFDIDTIFPLKRLLKAEARNNSAYINETNEGKTDMLVSIPFASYGGGENPVKMLANEIGDFSSLSGVYDIDFLEDYLNDTSGNTLAILYRAITCFTGFEPFKFALMDGSGLHYQEAPKMEDLINNAGGY